MSDPVSRPLFRVLSALQLDPSRKFGSMEEQTFALAKAFQERGSLFLPVYLGPLDPIAQGLYSQYQLPSAVLDLSHFRRETLRQLMALIRQHRIELINWNFYQPLSNRYLWALTLLMPWVRHDLTDHISRLAPSQTGARTWKSRAKGLMASRYRKILCVSDYVKALDADFASPRQLARWHHFVNTERFQPEPGTRERIRKELGDDDRFVLAIVAYLRKEKGAHVAIEALSKLPARCVLWIVGGGSEEAALREQADRLGVADRVRFMGHQADVSAFVKGADCLLCPSIWVEAAGLANLEALASGIPIIASKIGGIPEFVIEGVTGHLVPPGDADSLAKAIDGLQSDLTHRDTLARNAREVAIRDHSTQSRLHEMLALYVKGS